MSPLEITVIIAAIAIVVSVFGVRIYKRIHHMPVEEECIECKQKFKKAIKKMKKEQLKKKRCCC